MKKTSLIVLLLVAIVAMSFTFTSNPNPPRYANLKVLPKNTTKEQLDSVMKHFTAALGVKCNFCHVRLMMSRRTGTLLLIIIIIRKWPGKC